MNLERLLGAFTEEGGNVYCISCSDIAAKPVIVYVKAYANKKGSLVDKLIQHRRESHSGNVEPQWLGWEININNLRLGGEI